MPPNDPDLDHRLLQAHAHADKQALIGLYRQAADLNEASQQIDAACFYLTHAYIFALDVGAAEARDLHARLKARGREE
ncbi:MAG: hypothetical protein WBN04_17585 [Paracoccaceae bacterium]